MREIFSRIMMLAGACALLLAGVACGSSGGGTGACEGAGCAVDSGESSAAGDQGIVHASDVAPQPDTGAAPAEDAAEVPEDAAQPEEDVPGLPDGDAADPPADEATTSAAEEVIPISELSTTAKFFQWKGKEALIKYFGVLDQSGGVHVAFDACDVCYGAKKGYSQKGTKMICNNCGNSFDIAGIGTTNKGGGCWPGYLPATIDPESVHILHADLEGGSWYFE